MVDHSLVLPTNTVPRTQLPDAVLDALARAFPDAVVDDLAPLAGGRSGAHVIAFRVAGASYVLKRRNPAEADIAGHTERDVTCLTIASRLGVAPRVHYVDCAAGITIFDRIVPGAPPTSPLDRFPRLERIARAVRTLHDGPRFPKGRSVMEFVGMIDAELRGRGATGLPAIITETLSATTAVTQRFEDESPCHRDLNPGNMIVADSGVFLVDWDTAGQGDRFFDVAEAGVFSAPTVELREHFLRAYLGHDPNREERARAVVSRVMALGFYSIGFLFHALLEGRGIDPGVAPLSILEMLQHLAVAGSAAPPDMVAAALLAEMRREQATEAYSGAMRYLALA